MRTLLGWLLVALLLGSAPLAGAIEPTGEEFVGPFPSWANVKTDYGAVGDGKADDTAAIQRALEDVRGAASTKKVLYFPAGVYRITSTLKLERLSHNEPLGMSITGEDPTTTILRWDGAAGQPMLLYNAWYASLGRLTFDGAGRASTAIQHGPAFSTANEFTDVIIRDVGFGIEAGMRDGIAETAVLRCRFYRCSKAAISIQNFNTLDWYIWNSWFEDCALGVTNVFGAGNFHVYDSAFLRSTEADISIHHTGYFSFVDNVSVGSRAFFHAGRPPIWKPTETWGSQATLQNNLVLNPTGPTPILIENNGPNLLLDNTIRAVTPEPLVVNRPPSEQADLIAIGNRWTSDHALEVRGRVTELDNTTVRAADVRVPRLAPAAFAPHVVHPIIEITPGARAVEIQAAINRAANIPGHRPVVHLGKGNYTLNHTLTIPAGCDLQLVGDGPENATQISGGSGASPLIRVIGPAHATFRNLILNAGNNAVAIQLDDVDQPGARIFGEQLNATGYEYGLVTDGLRRASVELRDQGHNGLQVNGPGDGPAPWAALFCGASSRGSNSQANIHLYDVQRGGRLLVRDIWYEGQGYSMFDLTGSGEFALHSAFMAPYDPNHGTKLAWEEDLRRTVAPLEINGFRGKVALTLDSVSYGEFFVRSPSPDLQLYLLGFLSNSKVDLGGAAMRGQVAAQDLRRDLGNGTGSAVVEDAGRPNPQFIRGMLAPLRQVKPQPLTPLPASTTDVRFYRVWANGREGVRIQAAPTP